MYNKELLAYIESHIDEEPPILKHINRQAHLKLLHPRMVSGHIQGRLLAMLIHMIRPQRVLEIGTYTGYSALCIAEGLPAGGTLDTIEINDELQQMIQELFLSSAYSQAVQLHIGDALQIIPNFNYDFDVVFIDGNKRHYIDYYEAALKKLNTNGFIIADNTLWDGHVIQAHTAPNDLQTEGIKAFNEHVKNDKRVSVAMIHIRDGITILRKL